MSNIKLFYRINQFIQALTAKVTLEDQAFVKKYLTDEEQVLFLQLKVHEKTHCLRVAYEMEKRAFNKKMNREEQTICIRLGLLHDIGKIKYPLNPVEKGIIVILHKCTKGQIKRLSGLKMVKCYYHHPQIGYEILKDLGHYEEKFLRTILEHHQMKDYPTTWHVLLKECDDLN